MTAITIESLAEPTPGPIWHGLFTRFWPGYKAWYSRAGRRARPRRPECLEALRRHMPELLPTYERLCEISGDPLAHRFLSLWRPPPFLAGCSQAVWTCGPGPGPLIRNYEFSPDLFEGVLIRTAYTRRVMGMSDCLWGLLDGVNDAGLCAALAFGGRNAIGEGFGIPLVIRYVLETCTTTQAACATLARVPVHMAYNVTLVDASGDYASVQVGPDRPAVIKREAVTTNHQDAGPVATPGTTPGATLDPAGFEARYAQTTATHERACRLRNALADPATTLDTLIASFLAPPLFSGAYGRGWGTLYTAVYDPGGRGLSLRWPEGVSLTQSIAGFEPGQMDVTLDATP